MKRSILLTLIPLILTVQLISCNGQTGQADVPSTEPATEATAPASTETQTETSAEAQVPTDGGTATAPAPEDPFVPIPDDEAGKYGPLHRS